MKIEDGWRFEAADFSVQAYFNCHAKGTVTLVRSLSERAKWHQMTEAEKEDDEGPPLYVYGRGMTIEEAVIDANIAAAHAKPIPEHGMKNETVEALQKELEHLHDILRKADEWAITSVRDKVEPEWLCLTREYLGTGH